MRNIALSVLLSVLLVGCALIPKPLHVEHEAGLLPFLDAIHDIEHHQNKSVRWGGVIVSVENKATETVIELVEYPLSSLAKPLVKEGGSRGRFRVHVDGFIEPQDYQIGRSLTVVGTLTGAEQGTIGEYEYLFASVKSDSYYLWKEDKEKDEAVIYYHRPLIYDHWYHPRWVSVHQP